MFDETQIRSKAWVVKEVVDFILSKDDLKVDKIFLIGSYATGKQDEWSDIDFLVQLIPNKGRIYPNWNQIQQIHTKIGTKRIHVIFGTEVAQKSMLNNRGDHYKYREIPLAKESVC